MPKRPSEPYVADSGGDSDEDDDDDDREDTPPPKRVRGGGGNNFSAFGDAEQVDAAAQAAATAESELEAMLAAESRAMGGVPPATGAGAAAVAAAAAGGLAGAGAGGMPLGFPEMRVVETAPMDFRSSRESLPSREVPVPKNLVDYLMTPENRVALSEETGSDVEWVREACEVRLRGSAEQVKKAMRVLQRVFMHCNWGRSANKVHRLLKPVIVESAICRLSPMNSLRAAEKVLNVGSPIMSLGKDKANDVVLGEDKVLSRTHCVLELDQERGAVYAIDTSTNGTFLNGVRLPSRTAGKVLLSHGDELLFKDPASGDAEFGYIVNLLEQVVKQPAKFEPPRRLLTAQEQASSGRDFA